MKKLLILLAEIYVLVPHVLAQSNKDKKAGTLGHISYDPLPVYNVAFFSESLQRRGTWNSDMWEWCWSQRCSKQDSRCPCSINNESHFENTQGNHCFQEQTDSNSFTVLGIGLPRTLCPFSVMRTSSSIRIPPIDI